MKRLGPVFLAVLVDLLGFGIVLPLLPYTGSRFGATAGTIGLLYSVYSLSQLIFSPIWGSWSDKVGRRPIMLLSTAGSVLSYAIFSFAPSLTVLFVSRALAGIMGGNISAAQAYVADVTTPNDRAKGMGLIGAAFGIGFALGPALSGILMLPAAQGLFPGLSSFPYALPGLAAAGLSLFSFFWILFCLPESLQNASPDDPSRVQRFSVLSIDFWRTLADPRSGSGLGLFFLFSLILAMGHSTLYSAFPLFCRARLGMGPGEVGFQFLWMGLIAIFIQGGAIRVLVKRFAEERLFVAGNLLMSIGILLIPFAHSTGTITAALAVLAVGGSLNGPTITSLVSKRADPSHVGRALGSFQGMSAMGRVIGPFWGGLLFARNEPLPFLATGCILFGAFVLSAAKIPVSRS